MTRVSLEAGTLGEDALDDLLSETPEVPLGRRLDPDDVSVRHLGACGPRDTRSA